MPQSVYTSVSWLTRSMVFVAVLTKSDALSGNVATASRIWCGFVGEALLLFGFCPARGLLTRCGSALVPNSVLVGCCGRSATEILAELGDRHAQVLIAIHALHAGVVARASGLPYVLVLGGTDVNEDTWSGSQRDAMAAAVAGARCAWRRVNVEKSCENEFSDGSRTTARQREKWVCTTPE
jgi:hypothetical protein